ncbi:unnamed protein product [Lota lota]
MPAKAPIYLKPNNSKKGKKCRLRDILSPDMISPPLGDFRHTIHIGRGGERDAFGDMSFLQGRFELLPGKVEIVHPQFGTQSDFQRTSSTSEAYFAETPSPVLKNAISLPTIGGGQALTLPLISSTVFPLPPVPLEDILGPTAAMNQDRADEQEMMQMDTLLHSIEVFTEEPTQPSLSTQSKPDVLLDLLGKSSKPTSKSVSETTKMKKHRDSGVEEGRVCDFDYEFSKDKSVSRDSLVQMTGSMLSLELDLGPSILDEVLNIMDKPSAKNRP